jgi:Pectate lyase superfamily protein
MPIVETGRDAAEVVQPPVTSPRRWAWFVDVDGRPKIKDDTGAITDFTGSVIHSDPGVPAGALGKVGDFYINETTRDFYIKTGATTWTGQGRISGSTIYTGAGAPSNGTGLAGDFYIRTSNSDYYVKDTDGSWGTPEGTFQGIQGIQGIQGEKGWSPILSVVSDGARRVLQIVDWTGGAGTKPSTTNQFIGAAGIVGTAAAAVDIRGAQGLQGDQGIQGNPGTPGVITTINTNAGSGLSGGGSAATITLSVVIDGTTLEIATNTIRIKDLGVTTAKLADNAVDNTKIRDSAATSVIGRGANSGGDPADIAASADDQILRRTGGTLAFGASTDNIHGTRSGGTLHPNAVAAGAAGFMTGADKTKLDGIATGANVGPPTSRAITAGAGLTGGGDLSADRDIAFASDDPAIEVLPDNVRWRYSYGGPVAGANKSYAIVADRHKIFVRSNSNAAMVDTLPDMAAGDAGWSVVIHNTSTVPAGTLTVNTSGGDTFLHDGTTSHLMHWGTRQTFVWTGTNWAFAAGNTNLPRFSGVASVTPNAVPKFGDSTGRTILDSGVSINYISDKLTGIWIDVVADYGADKTGATDTTAQIQNAINAMPAGGGTLYFPTGTYQVSATITIDKPVRVLGSGRNISVIATNHATNPVFVLTTGAQGAGFEEIRISTVGSNNALRTGITGHGIDFGTIANAYIRNSDILYMQSGVRSAGPLQFIDDVNLREFGRQAGITQAVLIEGAGDRYISRLTTDNPADYATNAGIRVKKCSSLVISDCNIINSTYCISLEPLAADPAVASVLAMNTFFDSSLVGCHIQGDENGTTQRVRFVNCWFSTMQASPNMPGVEAAGVRINNHWANSIDFIACDFYQNPYGIDCLRATEWSVRLSRFAGNGAAAPWVPNGVTANSGWAIRVNNTTGGAGSHSFTISDNFIGDGAGFGPNGKGIEVINAAVQFGSYQIVDNRGLETNGVLPGIIDAGVIVATEEKFIRDNLGTGANTITSRNTASQTINTALANINGLAFPIIRASLTYAFDAVVSVNQGTASATAIGLAIAIPTGATFHASILGPQNSTLMRQTWFNAAATAQNSFVTATGFTGMLRVSGVVFGGANTGMVQIQMRANNGTGTVHAGGWIRAEKLT